MKIIHYRLPKLILSLVLSVTLIIGISSCAENIAFQQSSVVPAADGKVKVRKDDNNNYKINVEISDLAEIRKLYPRNYNYVVWMESEEGQTENLGQLVSSKGFFSGQLKASLETVSSFEPIKVFITAEKEDNVRFPGNKVILTTRRF